MSPSNDSQPLEEPVIVISGPTATGKSKLAIELAETIGGEIVNYDSIQVYRGFDIGSAKPSTEDRQRVRHHLIDIVEATDEFNAGRFASEAARVCFEIEQRSSLPILVGGTFFYLRAFLSGLPALPAKNDAIRSRLRQLMSSERGLARLHRWLSRIDPVSGARIAATDRHRIERALEVYLSGGAPISTYPSPTRESEKRVPHIHLSLTMNPEALRARLDQRTEEIYTGGLVEETRGLLAKYPHSSKPFHAIGYREAAGVVQGGDDLDRAVAETKRRTRAYAKRQRTWLRAEKEIVWIDSERSHSELVADALQAITDARARLGTLEKR